ncbi:hypothetical protein OIU76_009737 [Salix suchowensis]|nr:hypothetical protein OIU76_009737 [Salix suchowensis]
MGSQSNAVLTSSSSSSSSSIQAYTISIYRPLFKSFTYPSFTGSHGDVFEFDEADVWNSNVVPSLESKKTIPSSRCSKKAPRKIDRMAKDGTPVTCASLPVNIPDWSKIYSDHQKKENTEAECLLMNI